MYMRAFVLFMIMSAFFACTPDQKASKAIDHNTGLPSDFVEVLKAHGGIDRWRDFGTLEYDLQHEEDSIPSEHYILDLHSRKDLTVADSFKIGFDGQVVWVSPTKSSFKGRSARFYHN